MTTNDTKTTTETRVQFCGATLVRSGIIYEGCVDALEGDSWHELNEWLKEHRGDWRAWKALGPLDLVVTMAAPGSGIEAHRVRVPLPPEGDERWHRGERAQDLVMDGLARDADGGNEAARKLLPLFIETLNPKDIKRGTRREVRMKALTWPVSMLLNERDYDLDAPYQRGRVWDEARKVALIESVLQNLPIGVLFVNYRGASAACGVVVDGKQRITTLRAFSAGEFSVPAEWFERDEVIDPHATEVRWGGLTSLGQNRIKKFPVTVYVTEFDRVKDEERLFRLVNFTGVPQDQGVA